MSTALPILHALAALVILAEASFKAELSNPCKVGLCPRSRALEVLKSLAWVLLAFGSGASVLLPLMGSALASSQNYLLPTPSLQNTAVMVGFAVLIIRTRIKEGL